MLPTHRLVDSGEGYEIFQRQPGFEFTPILLGRIASFLARGSDGRLAVYAFMAPLLEDAAFDDQRLLGEAIQVIQSRTRVAGVRDREEQTFEYRGGGYVEVADPRWWIRTRP